MNELLKRYSDLLTAKTVIERNYSDESFAPITIESKIYGNVFSIAYGNFKDEMKKQIENRVHMEYENMIYDYLCDLLSDLDRQVVEMKDSLKNTLDQLK
jgi:hypothetical protein